MTKTINELRASIDAIDDNLIKLLNERTEIVKQVGNLKKKTQKEDFCYIRSGREADMVRRMYGALKDGVFPAYAAAQIWRIIISASLSLESSLAVTSFATDEIQQFYWLAREYFGLFTPIQKQPTSRRVISDIIEGNSQVGVLPMPDSSPEGSWWLKLPEDIKVFACIPFMLEKDKPIEALAIAKLEPEETESDVSLFSIETDMDVSQSRLKSLFNQQGLETHWLAVETFQSQHRVHLIEIKGFYTKEHESIRTVSKEIGTSLLALSWLGAYALPIII